MTLLLFLRLRCSATLAGMPVLGDPNEQCAQTEVPAIHLWMPFPLNELMAVLVHSGGSYQGNLQGCAIGSSVELTELAIGRFCELKVATG